VIEYVMDALIILRYLKHTYVFSAERKNNGLGIYVRNVGD